MATVIVTLKIMPESPSINLEILKTKSCKVIESMAGKVEQTSFEPVAFGLKSLKIVYAVDESSGDTEALENKLAEIDGVQSVSVAGVSRALG